MAKLLVIEDYPRSLQLITRALQDAGYEVDAANSFQAALNFIVLPQGKPATYAALLTDYNLGSRMTGLNVCQAAWRQFRPQPPIIATSSEMQKWEEAKDVFNLQLVPKLQGEWDAPAILAKLTELGITP